MQVLRWNLAHEGTREGLGKGSIPSVSVIAPSAALRNGEATYSFMAVMGLASEVQGPRVWRQNQNKGLCNSILEGHQTALRQACLYASPQTDGRCLHPWECWILAGCLLAAAPAGVPQRQTSKLLVNPGRRLR